jgi:uncharacterized protein YpmS
MGVDTKWLAKQQEARMGDTTVTITSETFESMADRIEELEAKHQEAFQMYVDANEARLDAEAKLAKAAVALEFYRTMTGGKDE